MKKDTEKKGILRIEVSGENDELWNKLKKKLFNVVDTFLDSTIDHNNGTTVKEESNIFISAILDHAKQRLAKSGLENEKIKAEIDNYYKRNAREMAETRKINAETNAIELDTARKKLIISLTVARSVIMTDAKNEDLVFARRIDGLLKALSEFK